MGKLLRLAALFSSLLFLPATAIAQPVFSGPSPISLMSSSTNIQDHLCTTTPSTLLARTINMSAAGDVGVHFSGEFFPTCRILLSLTRNGVVVPGPGDSAGPMIVHDAGDEAGLHGFNWAVKSVPAGSSMFRVMCRCASGTSTVQERSLIIYHR